MELVLIFYNSHHMLALIIVAPGLSTLASN